MDIHTIGTIIKRERKACGLSQKSLAVASHISRVTLVNLEAGNVGDIGVVKLAEIAENLGIPLFTTGKKMDFLKLTLNNINTSYKQTMTVYDLEQFILNGIVKPGYEGQVFHLIDETPTHLVAGAVKQLAQKKHVNAKNLWKNLAKVATQIKSPKPLWNSFG